MTALVLAILCVYLVERLRPLFERSVKATEARVQSLKSERMPADIRRIAMTYEEGWARDQVLASYRELYDDLGDWNAVRAQITGAEVADDSARG